MELWPAFWDIARERFWFGHGIHNEFHYVVQGLPAPHNQLLTTLLYGGIFAAILWGGIYAAVLFFSVRAYRGDSFSIAATTIYLIFHGVFETVAIASPGFSSAGWRWLYLWVRIGLAAGLELQMKRELKQSGANFFESSDATPLRAFDRLRKEPGSS
jgi:O-antigen ligase